ncbi:hypothetical protein ACEQPO_24130 [Bacillus sp. SL00103]
MLKRFIISLILLLMIGGSVELFAKDYNKHYAQFGAGLNMDVDQLEPFFNTCVYFDFRCWFQCSRNQSDLSKVSKMNQNNETKKWALLVVYHENQQRLREMVIEVHVEDGNKEVVIYMFSTQELVDVLDKELLKIEEAI